MRPFATICTAVLCLTCVSAPADEPDSGQLKREEAFVKMLSNTVLVGSFTLDGRNDGPPKKERYEIEKVEKGSGNMWTITARIKYGNVDTKLPFSVPVVWAGDTPMISLTNASFLGLGEAFSCRVIFYDNRYAGTWQHGKAGGHMFGRIEKSKPQAAAAGN